MLLQQKSIRTKGKLKQEMMTKYNMHSKEQIGVQSTLQ